MELQYCYLIWGSYHNYYRSLNTAKLAIHQFAKEMVTVLVYNVHNYNSFCAPRFLCCCYASYITCKRSVAGHAPDMK